MPAVTRYPITGKKKAVDGPLFTIDFMGIMALRNLSIGELASMTNIPYLTAWSILTGRQDSYHREMTAKFMRALGIGLYKPFFFEKAESGKTRLTIEWDRLLQVRGRNMSDLSREIGVVYMSVKNEIDNSKLSYNRRVTGLLLRALGVSVYPPLFILDSEESQTEGTQYEIQQEYHRGRKYGDY